jgi:manganese/zinc/iron transport system substrate-binding protein
MKHGIRVMVAVALAGLVVLLGGCGQPAAADGRPQVVATATMAADLVREIAGERVQVHGLMAPGVDPHSYTTRISDVGLLEKADLVVYVGLHLEGAMHETLEEMGKRGKRTVALGETLAPARLLVPEVAFAGHYDPHIWGDPSLWAETIPALVKALCEMDPEGASEYAARAAAYTARLRGLVEWARGRVGEIPAGRRVLVTSHDAFFYFGRVFGFEVRGLQGLSTVAEAGVRDRLELVELIKTRGLRTIFPETSVNAKGIQAVALESGAALSKQPLYSDSMGIPGDVVSVGGESYDRGTYIGMIKHNVNVIVDGLK